jgi:hypothetical protein
MEFAKSYDKMHVRRDLNPLQPFSGNRGAGVSDADMSGRTAYLITVRVPKREPRIKKAAPVLSDRIVHHARQGRLQTASPAGRRVIKIKIYAHGVSP